jgi:aspartate carbamoyltransferase catalytic subunit
MENRSLVTIAEHSKEKILYMLNMAKEFEAKPNRHLLDGKVVATLFFEPSTRTRLSFETAANRLGARVIGFSDPKATSSSKGETLKDTIKMVSNYADIIVMRHYLEGAALINARLRQDGFIHNRFKIQLYKHTEFWLQTELTAKKNIFIKNKDKFIKS